MEGKIQEQKFTALSGAMKAIEGRLTGLSSGLQRSSSLCEPLAYVLGSGGKRIRPALAMLSYQAASGRDALEAVDLGVAIEMFHNFTLIHDDIMDHAPVRRGIPTVHSKWNENTAILAGDGLFAWSLELLVKSFPEHASALAISYSRTAAGVCEGQMQDLGLAARSDVSLSVYLDMIRNKTALLIGGSMELGSIAAGRFDLANSFAELGEATGIAFQLQDDLLDAYGEPSQFGKLHGGDIIEGKKTCLLLQAFELLDESGKKNLADMIAVSSDPGTKVKKVLEIYESLGIREKVGEMIERYFRIASEFSRQLEILPQFSLVQELLHSLAGRRF